MPIRFRYAKPPNSSVAHAIRRIWFLACEVAVLATLLVYILRFGHGGIPPSVAITHFAGLIALFITSGVFFLLEEETMAYAALFTLPIVLFVHLLMPSFSSWI
jgi:hypothetical protein